MSDSQSKKEARKRKAYKRMTENVENKPLKESADDELSLSQVQEESQDSNLAEQVLDAELSVEDEKEELLSFRLSNEEYGVEINRIKEIIRLIEITNVPRTPGYVMGIISLRGVIVPVYDLKKRLGLVEESISSENKNLHNRKDERILIINFDNELIGVIVDAVTGVIKLNKESIEPTPPVIKGVDAEYLRGIGRINNRLLILLDVDRVLRMDADVQYS